MTEVSVIVPVYNVEKYIYGCIDSILAQTFKDFEVVVVDDGSTDKSSKICDGYAKKDNRVKVIHIENRGPMGAIATGINKSNGEYILFVDSDDWIDSDMINTLYCQAIDKNAEIVLCSSVNEFLDGAVKDELSNLKSGYYTKNDIRQKVFPCLVSDGTPGGKIISNSRCAKLYKSDLVKSNLKYLCADFTNGEDLQLIFSIILDAKSLYVRNDYFPYHYRVNQSSITHSYSNKLFEKLLSLNHHLRSIAKGKTDYDFEKQFELLVISDTLIAIQEELKLLGKVEEAEIIKRIKHICSNNEVQAAIKHSDLSKFKIKKKLFVYLIKFRCAKLIFWYLKKVALRRQ